MATKFEEPKTGAEGQQRAERTVPLTALVSTLVGLALMLLFWFERRYFRSWPDGLELAFVTGSSFLLVWGLTELIGACVFRSERVARLLGEGGLPRLGTSSWIGAILLSLGAGGMLLVPLNSLYGFLPLSLVVIGAGALLYGGKNFVDRLVRGRGAPAVSQGVALTRPGIASLVIAVILLAGAFLGPSNMLMLVFAMVVGPFVINGWYAFGMIRRLTIKRSVPTQVVAGDPVTVTLTLANRKRRLSGWLMAASDYVVRVSGGSHEHLTAETLFPRVPPRATRDASYRLRLMRRGRYRFGPVRVKSRFPLGLVERSLTFELPGELIVTPRLGKLADRWHREAASADELVQRRQPRRGAFPDEFEKLRLFRYGDNPRMIHWRTSARQNLLMGREYHEIRDRDLMVLLDLAAAADDEEALLRVELAVSFAATICVDQLQRSRQSALNVAAAAREFSSWSGVAHPASAEPLMRMLALVEPASGPDLDSLWEFARAERTPTTDGVLISTRPAEEIPRTPGTAWLHTMSVADGSLDEYFSLTYR
jgi:uncharacterized protein (DUF58 family)